MKIGGVVPTQCREVLVLPRPDSPDIPFIAEAVMDMEPFEEMCPRPKPPVKLTKNGQEDDVDSKNYLGLVTVWANKRHAYIVITSLAPSNIEWDTVDPLNPSTWLNWGKDLKEAGLCNTEVNRVQQCVADANALNEVKLKAAREAFLLGQGAA